MATKLFQIGQSDFIKSAVSAVFASVFVALASIATQPGFDIFAVDWHATLNLIINVSISTFIGDVARRFSSDKEGKLFGKIG